MGFSKETKSGIYYIHKKGKLFYFSKKKEGCINKPADRTVVVNKITGLPFLKK